jgi:ubiquinone/menaquinone biosynthesis C-methylase UbiE
MGFADHFSGQSGQYTQFRPRYPEALFSFLASLPVRREVAWDCGTGNGQAAVDLATHFARVVATDASGNQLFHALPHSNVEYMVASAEACPLESDSVDLVTVAQALHWFDRDRFYAQVRRVARSGSVIAAWTYGLVRVSPPVDDVVGRLYEDILGDYWPPERRLVEQRYATIEFPFEEIAPPKFSMTSDWTLDDLLGYLGTWSSAKKYAERHGENPLEQVEADLAAAWGSIDTARVVCWPLYLRAGRIAR